MMPACAGLLEHRQSRLELLRSMFLLKISHARCLGLSLAILSQFTFKMCATARKLQNNSLKNPF